MTIYLITGPPAAGKTTWVREHAQPGDITIDYDTIANVLTPQHGDATHDHPPHIKAVTKAARQAAIDAALAHGAAHDVYVIHALPSPRLMARYVACGAQVITIDPGRDVVMARCKAQRPWRIGQAARQWYTDQQTAPHIQQTSGASQQTSAVAGGQADATRQW